MLMILDWPQLTNLISLSYFLLIPSPTQTELQMLANEFAVMCILTVNREINKNIDDDLRVL